MSRSWRQHENRQLMARLNRDARRIALYFGLRYRRIEAERANVRSRYGICYDDGTIRIRLRHSVSGEPLKYSSLVNTLCHELAHLRYFDHGERFKRFYQGLLAWARSEGIYRPGKRAVVGPPRLASAVCTRAPGALPARFGVPPARREPNAPARASAPEQLSLF